MDFKILARSTKRNRRTMNQITTEQANEIMKVCFVLQAVNNILTDMEVNVYWRHRIAQAGNELQKRINNAIDPVLREVPQSEREDWAQISNELEKSIKDKLDELFIKITE